MSLYNPTQIVWHKIRAYQANSGCVWLLVDVWLEVFFADLEAFVKVLLLEESKVTVQQPTLHVYLEYLTVRVLQGTPDGTSMML